MLTDAEARYVRNRPQNFAGRWAAKEAVSKVLGLGVRGVGWRDIEIERLPTGQPSVRLHGRAAQRAEQLGMGRVAVSISHEGEYAVAIAFGIRTEGGAYVFPPDIEERLAAREQRLLARMERLRESERERAVSEAQAIAAAPLLRGAPAAPRPRQPQGQLRHACLRVRLARYAGAALLCGTAAARAGAGLVGLAVPASLQSLFAGRVAELITIGLPEAVDRSDIEPAKGVEVLKARAPDALVFGSGLRESAGYGELLSALLGRTGPAMVVDGGGLNLLSRAAEWWPHVKRALVLTPHPGEFARIMGRPAGTSDSERRQSAAAAAERFGQVVVLKGAHTVVATPDGVLAASDVATALLATAGTGDVLAGTIGSLLAQGVAPFDAARLGVYLHGRAAQRIAERLGDAGLLASELAHEIAVTRHELAEANGA